MFVFPDDPPDPPADPREEEFHNMIREYVVFTLISMILYGLSFLLISLYIKRKEIYSDDEEDTLVYRISIWMCSVSLATSLGATLLLPFSIVSNEILHLYPSSFWMQWLNESLIDKLWNNVFLFSNISLFILLPFAYFFIESEGFATSNIITSSCLTATIKSNKSSSKNIIERVKETLIILILLIILIYGITYILFAIFGSNDVKLINLFTWWDYLPLLYSIVSFIGVMLLLIGTPVGSGHLFTEFGEIIVKPKFLRNIKEEHDVALLEEMNLKRKINYINSKHESSKLISKSLPSLIKCGSSSLISEQQQQMCDQSFKKYEDIQLIKEFTNNHISKRSPNTLFRRNIISNTANNNNSRNSMKNDDCSLHKNNLTCNEIDIEQMRMDLSSIEMKRKELEKQTKASSFRRNVGYPLAMLALLCMTVFAVLLVLQNTVELLIGIKALPLSTKSHFPIGLESLSKLGHIGAALEILLIFYLWIASIVGLYRLPLLRNLRPKPYSTIFTKIIGNCALLLVHSSALPVLTRSIGITNFDLLGDFGKIKWLGNFYLVLLSNIIFISTTAISLANQFTRPVRRELWKRLSNLFSKTTILSNNDFERSCSSLASTSMTSSTTVTNANTSTSRIVLSNTSTPCNGNLSKERIP